MRCAAYVRVSTRQQTLEAQKEAIERAAHARGDEIGEWFEEKISAAKLKRPELVRLREQVRAGAVRKVYVFKLDRLSRSGIRDMFEVVDEFRRYGCALAAIADAFDLEGPAADVVLAVLAWVAQMERQALGERISAAREHVERKGGAWGRPRRVDPGSVLEAVERRAAGESWRDISVAMKIPKTTLRRAAGQKGHYSPGRKKTG